MRFTLDDFEKYLSKQLENAEFEAEWNKLELERKMQLQFAKKYPRVRLCKARLLTANRSVRKVAAVL